MVRTDLPPPSPTGLRRTTRRPKGFGPKGEASASPDTAGPLALAIHNQRVAVRHACRAGNVSMGGEGEQRHQGSSGPLQCGHAWMVHRIFMIRNARASVIGTQYDLRYTRGQPPQGGSP